MKHIRGLKDIKELNLTMNPGFRSAGANRGDEFIADQASEYICPVTSVEMNGKSRFSLIWTCGCVLSERCMKEIKSEICHKCNKPFTDDNVIPINPNEDEVAVVQLLMTVRREKAKAEKKSKKEGKRLLEGEEASTSSGTSKKKTKYSEGTFQFPESTRNWFYFFYQCIINYSRLFSILILLMTKNNHFIIFFYCFF